MKKGLILLSLIAMFVACGKKEEAPKSEVTTQAIVEQKAEETTPVVVENIEESVAADVAEVTNGEVVTEVPVAEETVVIEEKVAQ
ncbi:hypothetical protein [Cetobacterium somerae]